MFSFILSTILNNVGKQGRKTETPEPEQDIEPDNIFEDPFIDAAEDHNLFVDGGESQEDDDDQDGIPDDVDTSDGDTGVDDDSNEVNDDNSQSNQSDYERESDYDEQEDFEEQEDYDEQDDWEEQHESLDEFPYDDAAESTPDSQEIPSGFDGAGTEPELDAGTDDTTNEYTEPLDLETILDETVFDDTEPFQDFLAEVFEDFDQMMDHDEFVPEFNIDQWVDPGIDPFDEFMRNTF